MSVRSDAVRSGLAALSRPMGMLILVSAAHAITHVYAALFPLIYPIIQREWSLSAAEVGAMVGATSFLGGVLQLGFGFVARYYPRNVVLGLGNVLFGLTTGVSAMCASFLQFTALRWVAAVANAAQHPVGNSMIADRFARERRGSALAVNFAGGNIGTLAVPLIAVVLIEAIGWRETLWVFAIPGVVVGLLLVFGMSDRDRAARAAAPNRSTGAQLGSLLKNREVMVLIAASSVASAGRGLGVLLTILPLYLANDLGLSTWTVGVLYTILLVGSVVGPMLAGRLSDRLGRKAVLIGSLLLATGVTGLLPLSSDLGPLVLGVDLFLMGAFVFAESPLVQSFMADSVSAGERDLLFGVYFGLVFAVGAAWVVLIGIMIDNLGFGPVWWLIAASYTASALCVLLARERPVLHARTA